jgi:hypothetical protein
MTGRPRRRLPLALALTVIVAAVGWAALAPDAPETPTGRIPLSPDCLHIQGEELARNDRWRVVHTGDGGEFGTDYSPTPVVACDVRSKGAARVRLLGMAKLTGSGEDYLAEGGPYVEGGAIGADLVLIDTRFYEHFGNEGDSVEKGYTTLYDLRRGVATRLSGDWLQRYGPGDTLIDHTLYAFLTAKDGLTTVFSTKDGPEAPRKFGRVMISDARGVRWRTQPVDQIAVARPQAGHDDGGLYTHAPDGTTDRLAVRGAVITWALPADPKLDWRRMDLAGEPDEEPLPPESERLPNTFSLLPTDPFGRGGSSDSSLWLRYSPSDRARNHTVQITQEAGGGRTFARLARGSDDELRVLGSNGEAAIISGRFAERPQEQRVRLIGYPATAAAKRFFDLPATPAMRARGRAFIGGGYVLTDGSRLWVWTRTGGHVYRAPRLHDLQPAVGGGGVFATSARGRARFFS